MEDELNFYTEVVVGEINLYTTVVADEINLYSPHSKFKMVSVVMEFRTRIIQTSGITTDFQFN